MEHLVQDYPKGPDIGFQRVLAVDETLRGHIDGRAYAQVSKGGFALNSETEVSYLCHSVFEENVGSFDVSVNDIL